MNEIRKKAFDFAQDTIKLLISLATGIIALSISFKHDFLGSTYENKKPEIILWSWGLLLLSVFFGLWALLALTGTLEPKEGRKNARLIPSIRGANVRFPVIMQMILFAGFNLEVQHPRKRPPLGLGSQGTSWVDC